MVTTACARSLERVETLTDAFFAPSDSAPTCEISPQSQAIIDRWDSYAALQSSRARQIFARIKPDQPSGPHVPRRHPEEALSRFDGFLQGLPAGVQLFSLFEANPSLIDLIVDICATARVSRASGPPPRGAGRGSGRVLLRAMAGCYGAARRSVAAAGSADAGP